MKGREGKGREGRKGKGSEGRRKSNCRNVVSTHDGLKSELIRHKAIVLFHLLLLLFLFFLLRRRVLK